MKKFMNWLSESFAPTMNKFFSKPWLAAVSSCMQKIIPGSLTHIKFHKFTMAL